MACRQRRNSCTGASLSSSTSSSGASVFTAPRSASGRKAMTHERPSGGLSDTHDRVAPEWQMGGRRKSLFGLVPRGKYYIKMLPKTKTEQKGKARDFHCSFCSGDGRTCVCSCLHNVAPRCLSGNKADRTKTVLHHASGGDAFDHDPGSILLRGKVSSFSFLF